jgi:hypothetical protein
MDEAAPSFSFVWQHAIKTPLPGEHLDCTPVTERGFREKLQQVLAW